MYPFSSRTSRRTAFSLIAGTTAAAAAGLLLSSATPLVNSDAALGNSLRPGHPLPEGHRLPAAAPAAAAAADAQPASLLGGGDGARPGVDAPHADPDEEAMAHHLANGGDGGAGGGGGDGGSDFFAAFTQSLLLILACELGDRTFFVAAILAMRAPRLVVFAGAISALAAMTVLSAALGRAFPLLLDKKYTSVAASLLFAYFGVQLLRSWWTLRSAEAGENEELAEVEEELNSDKSESRKSIRGSAGTLAAFLSPVFVKSFTMTALAEWGDRSQIATIALAAAQNMWGVILGGIVGHACCTSLAVVGGRLLATRISEKAVALTGGILFLSFAVLTASGKLE